MRIWRRCCAGRFPTHVFSTLLLKMIRAETVCEKGVPRESTCGVPQGAILSPLLCNVFLHHVIDEWFRDYNRRALAGRGSLTRYADDLVMTAPSVRGGKAPSRRARGARLLVRHESPRREDPRHPQWTAHGEAGGGAQGARSWLHFPGFPACLGQITQPQNRERVLAREAPNLPEAVPCEARDTNGTHPEEPPSRRLCLLG